MYDSSYSCVAVYAVGQAFHTQTARHTNNNEHTFLNSNHYSIWVGYSKNHLFIQSDTFPNP